MSEEKNINEPQNPALRVGAVSGSASYYIGLGVHLNSNLGITAVTIDHNSTDLSSDSDLIKKVAFTIIKSLQLNKEDVMLQDLLNELNIKKL